MVVGVVFLLFFLQLISGPCVEHSLEPPVTLPRRWYNSQRLSREKGKPLQELPLHWIKITLDNMCHKWEVHHPPSRGIRLSAAGILTGVVTRHLWQYGKNFVATSIPSFMDEGAPSREGKTGEYLYRHTDSSVSFMVAHMLHLFLAFISVLAGNEPALRYCMRCIAAKELHNDLCT